MGRGNRPSQAHEAAVCSCLENSAAKSSRDDGEAPYWTSNSLVLNGVPGISALAKVLFAGALPAMNVAGSPLDLTITMRAT